MRYKAKWAWGSLVVKALRYQSDGPGIDSRWCHWVFFFSVVPLTEPCALRSTQLLKVSTRDFSWCKGGRCVWLTTYQPLYCRNVKKIRGLNLPGTPWATSAWAWGSVVVKALRYQSDGPGIDSRWCHWVFFFPWYHWQNHVPWGRLSFWKWVPGISPGVKAADAFGWRRTNPCSAETSRKTGALIYPEPLGPPRPVAGDLYLYFLIWLSSEVKLAFCFESCLLMAARFWRIDSFSISFKRHLPHFTPFCRSRAPPPVLLAQLESLLYK